MRDGRNSDGRLAVRQHEPALVFPDGHYAEEWRVEWIDPQGEIEVTIFAGPNARERAIRYADRQYGLFEEVSLEHP